MALQNFHNKGWQSMFWQMALVIALVMGATLSAQGKEIAVLLPIVGPISQAERTSLSKTLADALASRYELKYGGEVDTFVQRAFREESKKIDCDESGCYRRIAAHYLAEKIIAIRVLDRGQGGLMITSHIYDVLSGNMSYSHQEQCRACSPGKLEQIFSEFSKAMVQVK